MSTQRMALLTNKKQNALKISRRDIAQLIANNKIESAAIKVEGVIREQKLLTAFEQLSLHAELLAQRIGFLSSQKWVSQKR